MTALINFQISRDILEFHFSIFRNFYCQQLRSEGIQDAQYLTRHSNNQKPSDLDKYLRKMLIFKVPIDLKIISSTHPYKVPELLFEKEVFALPATNNPM